MSEKFVFIDDTSRPFMVFRKWLHYWHSDKKWVTLRKLSEVEIQTFKNKSIPEEHARLYGNYKQLHAKGGK